MDSLNFKKLEHVLESKKAIHINHNLTTTPTTTKHNDDIIHVELDPDLKNYIKLKLKEKERRNTHYEASLGCNVAISPTLFSSLTAGLSLQDIL